MKIIFAYFGGLLSVWLVSEGKKLGYTPDSDMMYALPAVLGTALADNYAWLADWLQKLKDKTTKS